MTYKEAVNVFEVKVDVQKGALLGTIHVAHQRVHIIMLVVQ